MIKNLYDKSKEEALNIGKSSKAKDSYELSMLIDYQEEKNKEHYMQDYYRSIPEIHDIIMTIINSTCVSLDNELYSVHIGNDRKVTEHFKTFLTSYNLGVLRNDNVILWRPGVTMRDLLDSFYMELQALEIYLIEPTDREVEYEKYIKEENAEYAQKLTPRFIQYINSFGGFNKYIPLKLYYEIQCSLEYLNYNLYEDYAPDSDYSEPSDDYYMFMSFLINLLGETRANAILNKKAVKRTLIKN